MRRLAFALLALLPLQAQAQMRGHGGPVRAVAVSPDGATAMTGSFDQAAILWSVEEGRAMRVLRFHEGSVNAVVALPDGRFATGGEDGRIAIWRASEAPGDALAALGDGPDRPERVIEGHQGPVVALALSRDGARLASASWDGTARVTPLAGGEARVLEGHQGNVNGVAFLPDGRIATAGYDATLRVWREGEEALVVQLPSPLNAVAAAPDGEIAAGSADGTVRLVSADGAVRAEIEAGQAPVAALAITRDGTRIAAASVGGSAAVIDRGTARVLFTLNGPGLPVWSLAFSPDGSELLTGGGDRMVRRWDMRSGEPVGQAVLARPPGPFAGLSGERGAEVFQACAACHALRPDDGPRAGPSLHRIFGRRIASLPGYPFSEALKGMSIVWTPETVSRLFEVGPSRYTPGTKMPEQVIGRAEDREALMRFLERATRD